MFRRRNADRTAHVRRELVAEFVRDVHSEPFQAQVRRRPYGPQVMGWPARRSAYFWPTPDRGLADNEAELGPLFEAAGHLSRTLRSRGSWTQDERGAALRLGQAMLDWGGPRQPRTVDEATVERVFRRALRVPVAGDVPMGSGWSKVAVLATTYLEGADEEAPAAEPMRWWRYVLDSLVETSIARDVLLLTRVDKPALLRRLFELGCRDSGQVLSYTKMVGQLQDAGNTTTLAHDLDLLAAEMLTGLQKFAGQAVRQRASSPKLHVLNTALMTAVSGLSPEEAQADLHFCGRLVESAVGAHLANAAQRGESELFYWRERNREVDFVVRAGKRLVAIEVESGRRRDALPGMDAFAEASRPDRTLLSGGDGIGLDDFLSRPVEAWSRR